MIHSLFLVCAIGLGFGVIVNALFLRLEPVTHIAIACLIALVLLKTPEKLFMSAVKAISAPIRYLFSFLIFALILVVVVGLFEGIIDSEFVYFRELAFDFAVAAGLLLASLECLGNHILATKDAQRREA